MGDTSNWEFAAAVAGVCIGLGGLLLFTLIGAIGSWRVFERANKASIEAAKANVAVQDLARQISEAQAAAPPAAGPSLAGVDAAAAEIESLRSHAQALMAQQQRLQDAVRKLVESGVLGSERTDAQLRDLEASVRRIEETLKRVAAVVLDLRDGQGGEL